MKRNKIGVKVKGITEDRREQLAEGAATIISVDNTRALATTGELGQFEEVQEAFFFFFSKKKTVWRTKMQEYSKEKSFRLFVQVKEEHKPCC